MRAKSRWSNAAADVLSSARRSEFEPFGWTERSELAAELRDILDDTTAELRGLVTAAEFMLESELYTFDGWEERLHASNLINAVVAGLQQQGGAN